MAQLVLLGSAWACSAESLERTGEHVDGQNAKASAEDELQRSGDTARRDTNEQADRPALMPLATTIRVVNGSSEVRSRHTPCYGSYTIGVRPAAVDSVPHQPTCSRVDCATLAEGEILSPTVECAAPACADARLDLAPGAADADFNWDGVYLTLTERNCYNPTAFEPGTPMLAHICFGEPGAGDYDVQNYTCTDYSFAYGDLVLQVELQ